MITLYLYPGLYGLADNNPYGLKVDTFLRLVQLQYECCHTSDISKAPRDQLPYLTDGDVVIGNSQSMLDYLIRKYHLSIDDELTDTQRNIDFLIRCMLDEHLYWIMSYSRWQDDNYYPLFKDALLSANKTLTGEVLDSARAYNLQRYHAQGIGRFDSIEVYKQGIQDLSLTAVTLADNDFFFGNKTHTIDACLYGFLANIYFYEIDTPLKRFIQDTPNLAHFCQRMREKAAKSNT